MNDSPVTRAEFERLEAKIDTLLSRSAPSEPPPSSPRLKHTLRRTPSGYVAACASDADEVLKS